MKPAWGGRTESVSWSERIASLVDLLPPLGIFLVVVGSIYADLATVRRLAGARTIEEDAADESAHTAALRVKE